MREHRLRHQAGRHRVLESVGIGLLSIILSATSIPAQDRAEMSLEDLLAIKVVTPTRHEQKMAESPSVISVLTARQIRDLGVTSIQEALSYLPGVGITNTYWGYNLANVRGQLQIHYNNKVLLMINGHPTREVINGHSHFELVPIQAVERIEFVRGPGSALYGTNAFAGVVNVITKSGDHLGAREIEVGVGSFKTWEASAVYGTAENDLDFMISIGTRNDDGYPYRIEEDERGQSGVLDYENDITNAVAVLSYKEITVSAAAFSQRREKFGIIPVIDYTGTSRYRSAFLDFKWDHTFSKELSQTSRLRWDMINRDSTEVQSFPFDGFLGHENSDTILDSSGELFGVETSLDYEASRTVSLLAGLVYEKRQSDPYTFRFADDGSLHPGTAYLHSPSAQEFSAFGQGLFQMTPKTSVVVGLRFTDDSNFGSVVLPRLGLVHQIGQSTYLKALYAEAFRTPDFFQTDVGTFDILYGNPDLKPEQTRNLDLAIDTTFDGRYNLQVNVFYLQTEDLVVRVPTSDPQTQGENAVVYVNADGEEVWGLEMSLRGQPRKSLRFFANYSYREGEDRESGETLDFIANHTFNGGLVWAPIDRLELKPNIQVVDRRGEAGAYALVNLVVSVAISKDLSLAVIGKNLADEEYQYPEYIRRVIPVVPGGPERSWFARLTWRY